MKLEYELTIVDMDGELTAVPTGENADRFRGIIKLNDAAQEVLEQLKEHTTPSQVHAYLKSKHPEATDEELGKTLTAFLNRLVREGLLLVP